MVGLQIGHDEEILAESSGVWWISKLRNLNQHFNVLVLTNKRIYGVYQKSNGLFKKSSEEIMELNLADIKISNNQPMVTKKWDFNSFSWSLEIQTTQGLHTFMFQESAKKNTALWETEIFKVFGIVKVNDSESNVTTSSFSGIAASLKGAAESVLNKATNQVSLNNTKSLSDAGENENPMEEFSEIPPIPKVQPSKGAFCSNCGTKLNAGAKFCHGCGATVTGETPPIPPTPPKHTSTGNYSSRVHEFVGTVLKCPNCGNVISAIDAVCPACGMHITGKSASGTVQKFSDALMEIEKVKVVENKGGLFAQVGYEERVRNAYATYYSQKLTLIRTFPIPNTVDEIYELMLLATTNIDVKLSKNTLWSKIDNSGSSGKKVSDAWIQKMRQAYQKAVISFPNDPVFTHIQKMYFDKMNELKIEP